jgi:hypothetical protein
VQQELERYRPHRPKPKLFPQETFVHPIFAKMHSLSFTLALLISAATAAELKVNYYSDGGCSDYILSLHPGVSYGCYDYNWQGSNSANIADCTYPNGVCVCTFYTQAGCKGASQSVDYPNNNCASNYGHGFLSMKCAVIHDPKEKKMLE